MGSDTVWYPHYDRQAELARLRKQVADLEAACKVLGEECRALRRLRVVSVGPAPGPRFTTYLKTREAASQAMDATDDHPTAAQYVKPKETTDGH